ncbi:MAG: dihydroneopterin aldolase [Kiritimatiellae bacterium]|nr:dihydroneopterin aldolase [Kiritimatiellia bacterium]
MNLELDISGIEVICILGDRPEERIAERKIIVNAHLEIVSNSAISDKLEDTVDYVELAEKIRARLIDEKANMIEHAAFLAAKEALKFSAVKAAAIEIVKEGAVAGIAKASCICRLQKGEEDEAK